MAWGSKLFVSDRGNHRVVVFDVANVVAGEAAESVLGAASLATPPSSLPSPAQNTLFRPGALALGAANQLAVLDSGFNRVMIFDVTVLADGEDATAVLGQSTFSGSTGGAGSTGLQSSVGGGLAWDVARNNLYVSDVGNNRILVFSAQTTGSAATAVYGQPDLASTEEGSAAAELAQPGQLAFDPASARFFAVDTKANRVLLFNAAP